LAQKDNELIKDFLQGNEEAFEELVGHYEKKVFSLCFHYAGNQEDALDLAQETFIRIYRFLPQFRFDAAFSTWVYRLTVNTCLDFLRKQKQSRAFSLDAPLQTEDGDLSRELADDLKYSPGEELAKKELRAEIRTALFQLPAEQRMPIILKEFQEMSYEEIARVLKIPVGTVRSRISRGRLKLKTILLEMELLPAGYHLKEQGEVGT
jgi:RNA polymerase sigma-70 factor, ECF subfamily